MQPSNRRKRLIIAGIASIATAILCCLSNIIMASQDIPEIVLKVVTAFMFTFILGGIILLLIGLRAKKESEDEQPGQNIYQQGDQKYELEDHVEMKTCAACGSPNPLDNNFCEQCGENL